MRVAILFFDYQRHEHSLQALTSVINAGTQFDLFTINRKGIAAAFNEGIDKTANYDYIAFCSNDITMQPHWLSKAIHALNTIPDIGTIGFHCVEGLQPHEEINGIMVHPTFTSFGNMVISRKVIDHVGRFNEEYDPYGMQDADYAYRLNCLGYKNYYLYDVKSEHIGADVGSGTEYRAMKDEGLSKASKVWEKWKAIYDAPEYLINQKQMYGEDKRF